MGFGCKNAQTAAGGIQRLEGAIEYKGASHSFLDDSARRYDEANAELTRRPT